MQGSQRERILRAAYGCIAEVGMRATTMDLVAQRAGLSRATLYRVFPGGRDEMVGAVVTWEVGRFFERLRRAVGFDTTDLATILERGILLGRAFLEQHEVLQTVLADEADRLLPPLATAMPLMQAALGDWLRRRLERAALAEGVDPEMAAEVLSRAVLSYIGSGGRWDLRDPDEVRRLVRDRLLAGVLEQRPAG